MAAIELDPMKMMTAGARISGEVAEGYAETGRSLTSGMPMELPPDLAVRAGLIGHRAADAAVRARTEFGVGLGIRGARVIAADATGTASGALGWIFELPNVAAALLLGYRRIVWPKIGFKPGPGGWKTKSKFWTRFFKHPNNYARLLNSAPARALGVFGTAFGFTDKFLNSSEESAIGQIVDGWGSSGSIIPFSPHLELTQSAAASSLLIRKGVVGFATGDLSEADAQIDHMIKDGGTVNRVLFLPPKVVGTALSDVVGNALYPGSGSNTEALMSDMRNGEYGTLGRVYVNSGDWLGGALYDGGTAVGSGFSAARDRVSSWF